MPPNINTKGLNRLVVPNKHLGGYICSSTLFLTFVSLHSEPAEILDVYLIIFLYEKQLFFFTSISSYFSHVC